MNIAVQLVRSSLPLVGANRLLSQSDHCRFLSWRSWPMLSPRRSLGSHQQQRRLIMHDSWWCPQLPFPTSVSCTP